MKSDPECVIVSARKGAHTSITTTKAIDKPIQHFIWYHCFGTNTDVWKLRTFSGDSFPRTRHPTSTLVSWRSSSRSYLVSLPIPFSLCLAIVIRSSPLAKERNRLSPHTPGTTIIWGNFVAPSTKVKQKASKARVIFPPTRQVLKKLCGTTIFDRSFGALRIWYGRI